jgi:hypothetical protein
MTSFAGKERHSELICQSINELYRDKEKTGVFGEFRKNFFSLISGNLSKFKTANDDNVKLDFKDPAYRP